MPAIRGRIWKIALTFAGTVIGAGFASGQELLLFFASYGIGGFCGALGAGLIFAAVGQIILDLSFQFHTATAGDFLLAALGPSGSRIYHLGAALFLLNLLAITLAAAGAVTSEYLDWPPLLGMLLMAALLFFTALFGQGALIGVNLLFTPLFIVVIVFVGCASLLYHAEQLTWSGLVPTTALQIVPHWAPASLLYVSYNLIFALTVLPPLGASTPIAAARRTGSRLAGAVIALAACFLTLILMVHQPNVNFAQLPMLYIASAQHPFSITAYLLLLITAFFSTGVTSLYGCCSFLTALTPISPRLCLFLLILVCLLIGQWGFATLTTVIFPCFGVLGFCFLLRLIWLAYRYTE